MNAVTKHQMVVINFFALILPVYFVPGWIETWLSGSKLLVVALSLAVIVPVVSYLITPGIVKILGRLRINLRALVE